MYSPGVLVGNWFEKRSCYCQKSFQHKSVYATDYCAPPQRTEDDIMGDIKPQENSERVLPTHDGFKNNFSTSYDLHYRIHPKGLCGPRLRTFNTQSKAWLPDQDYALNYGNITEFGLRAYKDEMKRVQECNERYNSTEYRYAYIPYSREFYIKVK